MGKINELTWLPVNYVVTGEREELEDLRAKLLEYVQYEKEEDSLSGMTSYGGEPLAYLRIDHFFELFGIQDATEEDLGTYWITDAKQPLLIEEKDGCTYFRWEFGHRGSENPKLREIIEGYYKSIHIYFEDPFHNTNDKEYHFFEDPSPLLIDGLHYFLDKSDHTAILNCDDFWTEEVMEVPEMIVYEGQQYQVKGIKDYKYYQPYYGCYGSGGGPRPERLRELRLPAARSIASGTPTCSPRDSSADFIIEAGACARIETLRKVVIPNNCLVCRDAFAWSGIESLTLGENVELESDSFYGIHAESVDIPNSTLWTVYDDFEAYGMEGHYAEEELKEDPGNIIFDVFHGSLWYYLYLLEGVRTGRISNHRWFIADTAALLWDGESVVKPQDVIGRMNDSDLAWLRKDSSESAMVIILYGMKEGFFTYDEELKARCSEPLLKSEETKILINQLELDLPF